MSMRNTAVPIIIGLATTLAHRAVSAENAWMRFRQRFVGGPTDVTELDAGLTRSVASRSRPKIATAGSMRLLLAVVLVFA